MSLTGRFKSALQEWSARAGYPMMPRWRLKRYEQSTHLRTLFDRLGIDCVLDVGANIGQYQEFLRLHVGYGGEIISFEPVRELFDRLQRASTGDPAWTVHPFALGDQDSDADINVLKEQTLTSFLPRDERGLQAMGYEKYLKETELDRRERVVVKRLDGVFPEVVRRKDARVFMKSDTQGFDMNVVRGARGCLDRIAALSVELSIRHVYVGAPHCLDAIAELTAIGYEVTGLFPVQRDSALRIVNLDCVMIRSDEAEKLQAQRTSYGN